MNDFRGIMPALLTPFDAQGNVNTAVLRQLIQFQLDAGVTGFYVNGSTGEGLLLDPDERKLVLETTLDAVSRRVPVIAHVGALSTRIAVDLAAHAVRAGAAAVAAIPPIYYAVDLDAIKEHYRQIAAVGLPLWIYHIPGSTGVNLSPGQFAELLQIEGVSGMKFSSYNFFDMGAIIDSAGECDFPVVSGSDEMLLPALTMGARGAVGSTYNLLAAHFVRLYHAFTGGNFAEAQVMQIDANRVIRALVSVPHIAALKELLSGMGFDCGAPRRPLRPLTDAERRQLHEMLARTTFSHLIV